MATDRNRAPCSVWGIGAREMRAYVRTTDDDRIMIAREDQMLGWDYIDVDRQTARMIARRINQCLDATVKR